MQSRANRQASPTYSAKTKPRFPGRSHLRLQLRRLLLVDPIQTFLRTGRFQCTRRSVVTLLSFLAVFLLSLLFLLRPVPAHHELLSNPLHPPNVPHHLTAGLHDADPSARHQMLTPPDLADLHDSVIKPNSPVRAHVIHRDGVDHPSTRDDDDDADDNTKDDDDDDDDDDASHDASKLASNNDPPTHDHPPQNDPPQNDPPQEDPPANPQLDKRPPASAEHVQSAVQNPATDADNADLRNRYAAQKMSIVVLFHNEYDSLQTALTSWINVRLVDYVDEVLFFLNGVKSETQFHQRVPDFQAKIPESKRRIVLSEENLPLGLAITKMVETATHDYVLLLEKDWELIENEQVMKSRLTDSKILIGTNVAQIVRHRHRHDPGVPLHALIMHQGREESIFRQQPNLLCYVHHWQKNPTETYPGVDIMTKCGGKEHNIEEEEVWCSDSEYCNWTNNPVVFSKKWFMEEVGERYRKEYKIEFDKYGKSSPFLDFEYYTNWRRHAWTEKHFTVALGTGLFRHAETEHRHFNTFWYAHYRLTVDLEEIRNTYLKNETKFKSYGGVHYDPNYTKPLTMFERYPVDFVRKFQFSEMFTGTLETQKEAVNKIYSDYQKKYRVTSEEWDMKGSPPAKATQRVDWRGYITQMHNAVEKSMMLVPPEQPHEMNITLVTFLLDIGRHELGDDDYKFRREFKMYLDAMEKWLTHNYSKVVYTSKQIADEVMKTASEEVKQSTKFVYTTNEELATKWLGPDNYAKVQEIRQSKDWIGRAGWLENSPQGGLEHYNPLVMSKMFVLRDAARQNFFKTTHFVFLDAKHNCMNPKIMTPLNDHIVRAHMFDKFLMTTFDYTPGSEVHGFEYEAFNSRCNLGKERQLVRVGRGGIFGGSAFVMEYITAMYDVALTAALRDGLMGTEENIFSILLYNVRQYIDEFSNNWACPDVIEKDHKCPKLEHQGYNCAIFGWIARNAVKSLA